MARGGIRLLGIPDEIFHLGAKGPNFFMRPSAAKSQAVGPHATDDVRMLDGKLQAAQFVLLHDVAQFVATAR